MNLVTETLRTPEERHSRRAGAERNSLVAPFSPASPPASNVGSAFHHKTDNANRFSAYFCASGRTYHLRQTREAIIHQLMANSSPSVADFHHGSIGDDHTILCVRRASTASKRQ